MGTSGCVIGFHASHEQFPPSHLLKCLKQAEQAGFQAAMCSDHYLPWSVRQGQSGFAWSWLGAALEGTRLPLGTVCAPGQRYHPAIIGQAAATLAEMYPGRFWLAVGSGEFLNEHILGAGWPSKATRASRLKECVDILRALWSGETVSHQGLVRVDRAQLYSLPAQPPLLVGAAITAETARWVASWADGLITVGHQAEAIGKIADAFRAGGGAGKPVFVQSALSYAPTTEEAIAAAYDQWRHCVLPGELFADLATPDDFDQACATARPDELRDKLAISSDLSWHRDWIAAVKELDVAAIYLHHVGRGLERFIDVFGQDVLP